MYYHVIMKIFIIQDDCETYIQTFTIFKVYHCIAYDSRENFNNNEIVCPNFIHNYLCILKARLNF
jgi:hypothetical protein